MDKKEQARLREQRQRDKERGNSVTLDSVTSKRDIEMFEGKPRYLTLSDGKVLDRANQPLATKTLSGMVASNRASSHIINKEKAERYRLWREGTPLGGVGDTTLAKLEMICKALDKETLGLDRKRVNLLSMVRFGVWGPSMESVGRSLS